MKRMSALGGLLAGLMLTVSAQAAVVFQGRSANGAIDLNCTPSGANGTSKCAMFYDIASGFTVLNNWAIGSGPWDPNAGAGSAQKLAADAGFAATGLTGWVLPTGNGSQTVSAANQFYAIWTHVGGSSTGLNAQFSGVQANGNYWSATARNGAQAWVFSSKLGLQAADSKSTPYYVVAIRPGDVALAVPEPETFALLLAGLCVVAGVARRRQAA